MVIILFICRHCDTVICSPILREWLLYCSCVVTVIRLYVAQYYVSGYYIAHISPKASSCIQLTKTLPIHGGNYGFCSKVLTLSHTATFPLTVRAACTYLTTMLVSFRQIVELCNI